MLEPEYIPVEARPHLIVHPQIDLQPLALHLAADHGEHIVGQLPQQEGGGRQLHLARIQFGVIQHIADELQQPLSPLVDDGDHLALLEIQRGKTQLLRHAEDAVHGGADLVAHGRQKLGLLASGPLRQLLGMGECRLHLAAAQYLPVQTPVGDAEDEDEEQDSGP
ncbi:hypothetical protein D3C78_1376770 [compost metagenome]